MKLKPIRDRIVVKLLEAETVTKGGLVIPDAAAEKPSQGIVLEVGTGHVTEDGTIVPLAVSVNDRVLFSKHAGQTVKIEGEEFHLLREEEVVAIIREGE
jgi:chaperonin GroES